MVLRREMDEVETEGGLLIPDTAQAVSDIAEVVSVGPGEMVKGERVPPSLKPGDRVVIGRYSGTDITVGGESLLLMREQDVLGLVE